MSTTFTLKPGYSWGRENVATKNLMIEIDRSITADEIMARATEWRCPRSDESGVSLWEYIGCYAEFPSEDLTCFFDEESMGIIQVASGGGRSREIKECLRRVYGALFLEKAYKRGLSVQFLIT